MTLGRLLQSGNGRGPLHGLRSLSASLFELKAADRIGPWYWVFLAAVVAVPWPMFQWPIPERAVPLMWVLVGGGVIAVARIARASWPFALLILWAGTRAAYHAFPMRTLQVLTLVLMAGLLYAAAREMPDKWARRAAWALMVSVGFEWTLGLVNAFGYYPFMVWVSPLHLGKPMAMLTHPNYWGSFMALSLPLVWALLGIPAAILVGVLILKTISPGPVIAAAVGALVMAWPLFGRKTRIGVALAGAASIVGITTLHEWRLSGRWEVWALSLKEIMVWPVTGQGLGQWRTWAEDWNRANYAPQAGQNFMVTLQAHNEPLQLWFELGVVGLILGALWALQAFLAAKQVWAAAPAAMVPVAEGARPSDHWVIRALALMRWCAWGRAPLERAWVAVLAVAAVNMLGSPTFHLPGQAAITLLALARVQADAEALGNLPAGRAKVASAKRARKERQHAALA